jgi:small subunit ribosomal protein S8
MEKDTTTKIADVLIQIRNANLSKHQDIKIPFTKINYSVADFLFTEDFIYSFKELNNNSESFLLLFLKYTGRKGTTPAIAKITRISKPGRRIYSDSKKMSGILGGTAIISTSNGLKTDEKASEEGIGGELLFYIW